MPLMKKGSTLSYSHGFNIVEEGMQIRKDITVMCAPKCPGSEVREEYKRSTYFNAVHPRMIQTETVLNKQKSLPATD
jgi:ketol-acid reductoisomerase